MLAVLQSKMGNQSRKCFSLNYFLIENKAKVEDKEENSAPEEIQERDGAAEVREIKSELWL